MAAAFNPLAGLNKAETPSAEERKSEITISPGQINFLKTLIDEKDLTDFPKTRAAVESDTLDEHFATLTPGWGGTASILIDALKNAPRKSKPLAEASGSIERTDEKLPVRFYAAVDGKRYHVDAPVQGKWGGWIFLKTGSEYHDRQRLGTLDPDGGWRGSENGRKVLDAILADPGAAMAAYGLITGSCGYCGRTLEDPESVARGIGPVCAEKGWF